MFFSKVKEVAVNFIKQGNTWPKAFLYVSAAGGGLYYSYKYTFGELNMPMGNLGDEPPFPPKFKWPHEGYFSSYDCASVRRGYQVYKQICSTCHSLDKVSFRHLVGNTHTEKQAKSLAAATPINDGPNSLGEMFVRPGKLIDFMPSPYKNEETAKLANGGALPPDLSIIISQTEDREDYLFSLLLGYTNKPYGVPQTEGKYWNTYFNGGWISMPPPLFMDDMVEYEDGTKATQIQMAKDVTNFLAWTNEMSKDEMKIKGVLVMTTVIIFAITTGIWTRNAKMHMINELSFWKKKAKL